MAQPCPLSALCTANEVAVAIETGPRVESFLNAKGWLRTRVFGSHGLVRIVEINRNFLAEADYGRVDFKRGIRNDRWHRVA
jgi:hypothetical protein